LWCICIDNIKGFSFHSKLESNGPICNIHNFFNTIPVYKTIIMDWHILDLIFPVFQILNSNASSSLSFSSTHLDFCKYLKCIFSWSWFLLSSTFIDLPMSVPTFHVPKWVLHSSTNFHTHSRSKIKHSHDTNFLQ
jgi:hypothetical protein